MDGINLTSWFQTNMEYSNSKSTTIHHFTLSFLNQIKYHIIIISIRFLFVLSNIMNILDSFLLLMYIIVPLGPLSLLSYSSSHSYSTHNHLNPKQNDHHYIVYYLYCIFYYLSYCQSFFGFIRQSMNILICSPYF